MAKGKKRTKVVRGSLGKKRATVVRKSLPTDKTLINSMRQFQKKLPIAAHVSQ